MVVAMTNERLRFAVEPELEMSYQRVKVGQHKPDFIVENAVVVELKAVKQLERSVSQQILTYLRVTGLRVGLVINFNAPIIPLGVKRFVL
jgi:GxxExxY protein